MKDKKKSLILSILLILGLIVVTVGVTYAFFNYTKEGSTENTLTTGTITFLYTEVTGVGKGISIDDAYPISDEQGKAQTGEGKVFDFKITSDTFDKTSIPYEVTARKKKDSTLEEEAVKLYLTKGETEEEVLLDNYSNLTQTSKVSETDYIEKTIYTDKVPANTKDYEETFRLRMWIDETIDFSGVEQEDGTIEYPYNDKTFTITVNVYANAKTVTEEDIIQEGNANITSISVDGTTLTKVEDETLDYDYETTLEEGTTNASITVETENPYATVEIEKLEDITAYNNKTTVQRLSTTKQLELVEGNNYFKITVTSEDKTVVESYILKVTVEESLNVMDSSYSLSIGDSVTAIDGSKWHVLETSAAGEETVVLLSDYNLNSNGTYNTTCGRDINNTVSCSSMFFNSKNNVNTYDETESSNIGYFIKNTYEPLVTSALTGTINVTLPTVEQIQNVDGITVDISSNIEYKLSSSWLTTTNYYTKTANTNTAYTYYVWAVYGLKNDIRTAQAKHPTPLDGLIYGARPVITTPKTNLLAE